VARPSGLRDEDEQRKAKMREVVPSCRGSEACSGGAGFMAGFTHQGAGTRHGHLHERMEWQRSGRRVPGNAWIPGRQSPILTHMESVTYVSKNRRAQVPWQPRRESRWTPIPQRLTGR